jgi:hypothetical protein
MFGKIATDHVNGHVPEPAKGVAPARFQFDRRGGKQFCDDR